MDDGLGIPVTGVPWLDMLALIGAVLIALAGVAAFVWAKIRPHIEQAKAQMHKISQDSAQALDQVQNTHTTNLRHDLDELAHKLDTGFNRIISSQEQLAEASKRHERALNETGKDIREIRGETRDNRAALDRHVEEKRDYGLRLQALEQKHDEAP